MPEQSYRHLSDTDLHAAYADSVDRQKRLLHGRYVSYLDSDERTQWERNKENTRSIEREMQRRQRDRNAATAHYNKYQLGGMKVTDSRRMREDYKRNNPRYREPKE